MSDIKQLIESLAGHHYDDIRTRIDGIDFDGIYPEVDSDGLLTGAIVDAQSQDHDIVDLVDRQPVVRQSAADAMMPRLPAAGDTYFVLSGEGEHGSWEKVQTTEQGIQQLLTKERCSGDRWARAYGDVYELADGGYAAIDVDTGDVRQVPSDLVTT